LRKELPHCYSNKCNSHLKYPKGIVKHSNKDPNYCDDCRSALVWKLEGAKAKVVSTYKQARKEMTQKLKKHMERK